MTFHPPGTCLKLNPTLQSSQPHGTNGEHWGGDWAVEGAQRGNVREIRPLVIKQEKPMPLQHKPTQGPGPVR